MLELLERMRQHLDTALPVTVKYTRKHGFGRKALVCCLLSFLRLICPSVSLPSMAHTATNYELKLIPCPGNKTRKRPSTSAT